jgi:hypothetical protein
LVAFSFAIEFEFVHGTPSVSHEETTVRILFRIGDAENNFELLNAELNESLSQN